MKTTIVANWKMKLGLQESIDLAKSVKNNLIAKSGIYNRIIGINNQWAEDIDVILCPSFTALSEIKKLTANTGIMIGAQDVFWKEKGAYTGEIAPSMLLELNVNYVIVGHSERRRYLNETDEIVHQKIKLALEENIIPILCIGENENERNAGRKDDIILSQLMRSLEGLILQEQNQLWVAYEPVWAIGTGQPVEPGEAALSAKMIKTALLNLFPQDLIKNNIGIMYGGSVSSKDAKQFLDKSEIDGLLVGTASWNAEEFLRIINQILDL